MVRVPCGCKLWRCMQRRLVLPLRPLRGGGGVARGVLVRGLGVRVSMCEMPRIASHADLLRRPRVDGVVV